MLPRSNGCPPNDIGVKNLIKAEYGKVRVISVFVMLRFRLSLLAYVGGQAMCRMGIVQRLISTKCGEMEEVLKIKMMPKVPLRDSSQRHYAYRFFAF